MFFGSHTSRTKLAIAFVLFCGCEKADSKPVSTKPTPVRSTPKKTEVVTNPKCSELAVVLDRWHQTDIPVERQGLRQEAEKIKSLCTGDRAKNLQARYANLLDEDTRRASVATKKRAFKYSATREQKQLIVRNRTKQKATTLVQVKFLDTNDQVVHHVTHTFPEGASEIRKPIGSVPPTWSGKMKAEFAGFAAPLPVIDQK